MTDGATTTTTRARPKGRKRFLRVLAALAVGVVAAGVGAELVLRWLLFSDSASAREMGYAVRVPEAFGTPDLSAEYWYLQHRFTPREKLQPAPGPDAQLGWNGDVIDASGRHYEADRLGERTPVLLYGDSFAQGVVGRADRFQGILDHTQIAERFCLLNHGVGGYGTDQAWLLLERTLDRYLGQDTRRPIVIFSMLVDSDLDRSALAFRGWPKPRLEVEGDALVLREVLQLDPELWFAAHEPKPWSWLLRFATFRAGLMPERWRNALITREACIDEKRALNGRILECVQRFCAARGVPACVLLFHSGPGIPPVPWMTWQEPVVRATCERIGLPLVDVRPYFDALTGGDDAELARYFILSGAGRGHLNEAGNRVAFEAMAQAIETLSEGRTFAAPDLERVRALRASGVIDPSRRPPRERELAGRAAWVTATPAGACIRVGSDLVPLFDTHGRIATCVRAGDDRRTEVAFVLDGAPLRMRAELAAAKRPGVACDGEPVLFKVLGDGRELLARSLTSASGVEAIDLDLAGVRNAAWVFEKPSGRPDCTWVVLVEPRFE